MKRFIFAEHIKLKKWQFYILPIFIGVLTPLVLFITKIFNPCDAQASLASYYYNTTVSYYLSLLSFLLLIISSRITYVDHKNNGWQLMETQPLSKFNIYWGKLIILFFALIVSVTTYMCSVIIFAKLNVWCLGATEVYSAAFDWKDFFVFFVDTFVNSLFLLAVLYIASIIFSSFVWLLAVCGLFLFISLILYFAGKTQLWNPLHTLMSTKTPSLEGHWFTLYSLISITFASILLFWGYQWYKIKHLKTFMNSRPRVVFLVISIILGVILFMIIIRPSVAKKNSQTVICGKLDGVKLESPIYVLDEVYHDTIAIIPVDKNGSFHYTTKERIAPQTYTIVIGNRVNKIFFGTNDSLCFRYKDVYESGKVVYNNDNFSGTRVAEFNYSIKISFQNNRYIIDLFDNNIDKFTEWLNNQYHDNLNELESFRTNDNMAVAEDFKQVKKKMIAIECLSLWDYFVETRAKKYQKDSTPEPSLITELRKSISMDDPSLIGITTYSDYIYSKLLLNNKDKKGSEQSILLDAITRFKRGSVRDMLLYKKLHEAIFSASTRSERSALYNNYISFLSDNKVKKVFLKIYESAERVGRGNPAPEFFASSQLGKQYKLSDFKGKVVVIDVWATWCGPCLQMVPHFDRMAYIYKQNNIQFISLSVDKDKNSWLYKVKDTNDETIMRLHINDFQSFSTNYNLQAIPRFILIDENGKFINSDMPAPDGSSFEQMIRTALNLKDQY